jgi:hypothetical protein
MATERNLQVTAEYKLMCTEFNAIFWAVVHDAEDGDIIILQNIGIYLIRIRHSVTPQKN